MKSHDTIAIRKKNLQTAYKRISKNLNNTPKMTENSYVFSGFPTLYIEDPDEFLYIAKTGLSNMIKHFKRIDWRDISNRKDYSDEKLSNTKLEHIVVFIQDSCYDKYSHRFPTKLIKHISM